MESYLCGACAVPFEPAEITSCCWSFWPRCESLGAGCGHSHRRRFNHHFSLASQGENRIWGCTANPPRWKEKWVLVVPMRSLLLFCSWFFDCCYTITTLSHGSIGFKVYACSQYVVPRWLHILGLCSLAWWFWQCCSHLIVDVCFDVVFDKLMPLLSCYVPLPSVLFFSAVAVFRHVLTVHCCSRLMSYLRLALGSCLPCLSDIGDALRLEVFFSFFWSGLSSLSLSPLLPVMIYIAAY